MLNKQVCIILEIHPTSNATHISPNELSAPSYKIKLNEQSEGEFSNNFTVQ